MTSSVIRNFLPQVTDCSDGSDEVRQNNINLCLQKCQLSKSRRLGYRNHYLNLDHLIFLHTRIQYFKMGCQTVVLPESYRLSAPPVSLSWEAGQRRVVPAKVGCLSTCPSPCHSPCPSTCPSPCPLPCEESGAYQGEL